MEWMNGYWNEWMNGNAMMDNGMNEWLMEWIIKGLKGWMWMDEGRGDEEMVEWNEGVSECD